MLPLFIYWSIVPVANYTYLFISRLLCVLIRYSLFQVGYLLDVYIHRG